MRLSATGNECLEIVVGLNLLTYLHIIPRFFLPFFTLYMVAFTPCDKRSLCNLMAPKIKRVLLWAASISISRRLVYMALLEGGRFNHP